MLEHVIALNLAGNYLCCIDLGDHLVIFFLWVRRWVYPFSSQDVETTYIHASVSQL
jgi:hypothetical protein